MTLSLPSTALSIAELDDLDHGGVVRFVRVLEESGHRMVWIPEVAGREAFTTAALVLGSTQRMIVGNGVVTRLGFTEADLAPPGSDRLIDALVACGTPEQVREALREQYDAGATQVAVSLVGPLDEAKLDAYRALAP